MKWEKDLRVSATSLIEAATRAPSSHNTQPWIFRVSDCGIDLLADRTRALPVNDPEDRELTMSCGCALLNLRAAAAGSGLAVAVSVFPDGAEHDLVARVRFSRADETATTLGELAGVIDSRRTYRKQFDERRVPSEVHSRLEAEAQEEGVLFRPVLEDDARRKIAELVSEGDSIQWADRSWRRELASWMHPRREGDGLATPPLTGPIARTVVRTFDMGGGIAARDRDITEKSPFIAAIGTESDGPEDWLRAGQGLERILLAATEQGLQASHLNQPVQVSALRSMLGDLLGLPFPQAVLRFGYPRNGIDPTPRRPVEAVIE